MASGGVPASRQEGERGPVADAAGTASSPFGKMWAAINPFATRPQGARTVERAPAGYEARAGLRSRGQAVYGTLSAEKTRGNDRRQRQLNAPVDGQGQGVPGSYHSLGRPTIEDDADSYDARDSSVWTEARSNGGDNVVT